MSKNNNNQQCEFCGWSEEDDKILDKIITALMGADNVDCDDFNIMYNWLITIKEK